MKNKKAFRLFDIMIVLAIVGLLAAIPLPFMLKPRAEVAKEYSQETAGQITANQSPQEQVVPEFGDEANPAPQPEPETREEITAEDSKEADKISMALKIAERCMRDAEKYEYSAIGEDYTEDRADEITPAVYYALKALYYQNIAFMEQNRAIANLLKKKAGE